MPKTAPAAPPPAREATPTFMPVAAAAPLKQKLLEKNCGVASFNFTRWSAVLEKEQALEDALEPAFWSSHVGKILGHDTMQGRGDIIEIRKLDSGLYAELLVVEAGAGFIRVEVVHRHEPKPIELPANVPFTTRWNAGKRLHEVIRKADGAVMAGNFQTRGSAARWIAEHMKALAA